MRYFFAVCLLMISASIMAVPAKRIKKTITLADGTHKEVMLVGDENIHYYLDDNNIAYTCNEEGVFVRRDRQNLENQWNERLARRNRHRLQRAKERGMVMSPMALRESGSHRRAQWGAQQNPVSGDKKGLVILVNFPEKTLNSKHREEFYDRFFNEEGFSEAGNVGSVHDYFYENSYGQFNLTFDIYGPVYVSNSIQYYGKNNSSGYDSYPAELVAEACTLVDELGADFTQYDWDDDGMVDQVFLVYAGYGEHAGAPSYTIWPHEGTLTDEVNYGDGDGPITLDGVVIDTYAVASELDGNTGTTPAGIGTACHEFSHCMCIPDFYDTSSSASHYGMDMWDLMDFGSYSGNYNGNCPAPYTSYERMYCGWLTPKVLDSPCMVKDMKTLYQAPEAYIIYNDANHNEYYLLENRQGEGFGASDPASGLLILHVFFDSKAWIYNTVNNNTQRMTIIPADGVLTHATNYRDTWPGTTGKTELTDTSSPAATLYTANSDGTKNMGKPIENIEDVEGKISFVFNGGYAIEPPHPLNATEVGFEGFTARWDAVEGAESYKLKLTVEDMEPQLYPLSEVSLLEEDFNRFNNGTTTDGTYDISAQVNNYTATSGWEGEKLYTTPQEEVKMGSSKSSGSIYSPWISTQSDMVTLVFTARQYGADNHSLIYGYGDEEDTEEIDSVRLTSESVRYVANIPVKADNFWLGLYSKARCYISEIIIYDGTVTEEQLSAGLIPLMKTKTEVVETSQNSYVFTGLSNQCKYAYSVCAQNGNVFSKWSNQIEVLLPTDPDGVVDIEQSPLATDQSVYDLSGRKVTGAEGNSSPFTLRSSLKKGIYIQNGKKFVK